MRTLLKSLFMCAVLLGVGCKQRELRNYPSIMACDLVIVHHDGDGRLIDFIAFREIEDEKTIRVKPTAENEDLFFVTIFGTKISHSLETKNAFLSSSRSGHRARIDLFIRNGKVKEVVNDGKLSPSRVSDTALEIVESFIVSEKEGFLKKPTISVKERFTPPVVKSSAKAGQLEASDRGRAPAVSSL